MGRLGDPRNRPSRRRQGEARTEPIRGVSGAGESERPIVAMRRGNARGAKGPWREAMRTQKVAGLIGR